MPKQMHCPMCGATNYSHKIKLIALQYKGETINIQQPGFWCDVCGDGVIGGKDHKATQKQLQTLRAKIDDLLVPDEIKRIRCKLKLTQRQASEQFGGGINAFSRYERGELPIYRATSQLLKLLDKHPEQLQELFFKRSNHGGMDKCLDITT